MQRHITPASNLLPAAEKTTIQLFISFGTNFNVRARVGRIFTRIMRRNVNADSRRHDDEGNACADQYGDRHGNSALIGQ